MPNSLKYVFLYTLCICLFNTAALAAKKSDEKKADGEEDGPPPIVHEYDDLDEISLSAVEIFMSDLIEILNSGDGYGFSDFAEVYVQENVSIDFMGRRRVPQQGAEEFYVSINEHFYNAASVLIGFFNGEHHISHLNISNDGQKATGRVLAISYWDTHTHLRSHPSTYAKCKYALELKSSRLTITEMSCNLYSSVYLDRYKITAEQQRLKRIESYYKEDEADDTSP